MGLTQAEYARHRRDHGLSGGTRQAVHAAIERNRLTPLADGTLDPVAADREWAENTWPENGGQRPGAGRPAKNGAGGHPVSRTRAEVRYVDARRARELIKCEREALELEIRRGEMVRVTDVVRTVERWTREQRDALLAWPASVADELAAECHGDPQRLRIGLEREMRALCEELSRHAFVLADQAE
jgi:hypothetical protein